jgi:hypothetical protein
MPVVQKIISIDVQSNLAKFTEEFNKYDEMLNKQPEIWSEVGKENKAMGEGFKVMAALMLAQNEMMTKIATEGKKVTQNARDSSVSWASMVKSSKSVYNNVLSTTRSLAQWTGIFSALSGLALGGSVWGLERLAAGAGAGRRNATGLGLSYGQNSAFGVTYGRFVDTNTLLHGVSTARGDVGSAEARAMFSLGMVPGQSGDTAQASLETLKRVRALAKRTPDQMLGTVNKAYGLDALGYNTEQMRRLKSASDDDIDEKGFNKRTKDFGVTEKALKDMQEFDMALESAGIKIKSTFIELLGPLAPELKLLTEGLSDAAKAFLGSQTFKDGIEMASKGLHEFGLYVNKPEFKQDLKDFADGIGYAAKKLVGAARFLGLLPQTKEEKAAGEKWARMTPGQRITSDYQDFRQWLTGRDDRVKTLPDGTVIQDTPMNAGGGGTANGDLNGDLGNAKGPGNNLFGMRPIGAETGFQGYATKEDSILSASKNLIAYDKVGWNTLNKIISHWAPPKDANGNVANDTQGYINNMVKRTGYGIDQELDLKDPRTRAMVLSGIAMQEQGNRISPGQIEIILNNNTGGNTVVSTATAGGVSGPGTPGPSIVR